MQYLKTLLLSIAAVFTPVKALLITALVLVIADFITGVAASIRKGKKITSRRFKESILKAILYQIAIMLAFLAEHYLIGDAVPATKIIATLIGLTELKSCLENLDSINGKPMFRSAIKKLVNQDEEEKD